MNIIQEHLTSSIEAKKAVLQNLVPVIEKSAEIVWQALKAGRKILFFGNGGSASDAQHLAAELVGRYEKERRALASIALTTDTSILTAVANDYAYENIFTRQIEALGQPNDVAFGISTSGNSKNVNRAIELANQMGLKTIGMSGKDGGELGKLASTNIIVPSKITAHIQESHIAIGHAICRYIDMKVIESTDILHSQKAS